MVTRQGTVERVAKNYREDAEDPAYTNSSNCESKEAGPTVQTGITPGRESPKSGCQEGLCDSTSGGGPEQVCDTVQAGRRERWLCCHSLYQVQPHSAQGSLETGIGAAETPKFTVQFCLSV